MQTLVPAQDGSINIDEVFQCVRALGEELSEYFVDGAEFLNKSMDEGKSVLFEGAQGTMLDVDHGTYPYVTASSATAGGACTGTGVGPTRMDGVIGISKAYTTRVGEGPFPTELLDSVGEQIRNRGQSMVHPQEVRRAVGLTQSSSIFALNQQSHPGHHQAGCPRRIDEIKITPYRYKESASIVPPEIEV
jgi:adenylosuccinate synthase